MDAYDVPMKSLIYRYLFFLSFLLPFGLQNATAEEPEIINGHVLPPEPDPKINNATLLGIDSNDNGVRDDVERWIFKTYKDKHPVHIDIAMQAGRDYKEILKTPEKAKAIRQKVNSAYYCSSYYQNYAQFYQQPTLVHERIDVAVKNIYFNTVERKKVYFKYDELLSGDSYTLPKIGEMKHQCDFDTTKYDNEVGQ